MSDDVPICTCMQYAPREHLRLWQARFAPILQRMSRRGYCPDTRRLDATFRLIMLMETGAPECFSDDHRHRSHHLPGCPWAWRNRGPKLGPDDRKAAAERIRARAFDAARRWAATLPPELAATASLVVAGPGPAVSGR